MSENNENDNKTVYILDSYGLIFRCYFAFINRPLTNANGKNISALFGFFRNFHYILKHYNPKYIFAAMDSKTKTFRHELYEQYKATRNKTPEDLHAQIPWIEDILCALGIPVLRCDGYEADDVIATVASKCTQQGRQCRILSGDKDLMQLVNETTMILKPESAGWKLTGTEGVKAEWGVEPSQILDLLSLFGDSADNIPGVSGIGVKTASKLLLEYKNLDGIYNNIENIKGAMQKKLIDGKESAYFSQKLVKLCTEVPCSQIDEALNAPEYSFNYADAAEKLISYGAMQVSKQYAELAIENGQKIETNFSEKNISATSATNQESSKNENSVQIQEPVQNHGNYKAIVNANELHSFIEKAISAKKVAFDCETTSLDTINGKMVGFSLCYEKGNAVYVPLSQEVSLFEDENITRPQAICEISALFETPELTLIFHNAKFDYKTLRSSGLIFKNGKPECKIADTMIAQWLLSPEHNGKNSYGLEYLAETKLHLKGIEFDSLVKKGQTFSDVSLEKAVDYAAEDADFTFQLWQKLELELEQNKLTDLFTDVEMKLVPILAEMELTGIHLDSEVLEEYNKELTYGIEKAEKDIYLEAGEVFNIASPKQLQAVLFEKRGLKPGKKTKTGYSTDTSVLEELAHQDSLPKMILEYRELSKLQSTYVETLPAMTDKEGRIHTNFIQTGTATGRLSCRDPNLQNIPVKNEAGRRIRSAFTAPKGKILISADYAQIELVVLAHLSKDKNMRNAFINGNDVHKATAALIFGVPEEQVTPQMRRTAKTINFGVIYGMSAFRLANDLEIPRTQAAQFIQNYFETYSSINDFIKNTIQFAEQNGYVETIFGRKRPITNINSRNKLEKAGAERIAVNTPVQGSAADIVKKAMIDVEEALFKKANGAKLLLQVHDELILECPDEEQTIEETIKILREKMENAVKLSVPLRVSIEFGKNWGEFH